MSGHEALTPERLREIAQRVPLKFRVADAELVNSAARQLERERGVRKQLVEALRIQREELQRIHGYVVNRNNEAAMDVLGIAKVGVDRILAAEALEKE